MITRPGARRLLADWSPTVVLSVAAGHELLYNHSGMLDWLMAVAILGLLVVRRRWPEPVLLATFAIALTGWVSGTLLFAQLGVLVALHAVAVSRPRWQALAWAGLVESGAVLVSFRFAPTGSINDAVVLLTGLTASALLLGTTQRAQRQYLAALEDRTRQLERERQDKEAIAAAAERTRIARDIHDIVAHSVSVMIAMSEGAAATVDPDESRRSMRQVATTGREALNELRRVLSVLRSRTDSDRDPLPSMEALPHLTDDVRRAGLSVDLHVDAQAEAWPEAVQATVFRLVQECLTNTLKHADHPTHAVVTVTDVGREGGQVLVVVTDDGRPHPLPREPEGNGLHGMRERAEAFGGSLTAGPTEAGWEVRCRLRLRPEPHVTSHA